MNLRDLARKYEWLGVQLWYLPYRTLAVDVAIRQLESIEPHSVYVNAKTGERSAEKPADLAELEKQAESRAKVTKKYRAPDSDWAQVDLWDTRHNTYAGCLPLVVDAEFPETMTGEVAAFASFWNAKLADPAERWQAFAALIGTNTANALWDGYTATRETPLMPGLPELGEANEPVSPLPESAGAPLTEATTAS